MKHKVTWNDPIRMLMLRNEIENLIMCCKKAVFKIRNNKMVETLCACEFFCAHASIINNYFLQRINQTSVSWFGDKDHVCC